MPEFTTPNLFQRINSVMMALEAIDKTGENKFQHYNFIKAETLFAALQKKLATAGIVVIPTIEKMEVSPGGDKSPVLMATMKFRVVNADDPADFFEVPWMAQAGANDDKGANKCATSGMKYFLMRLFFISDEEDPDAEEAAAPVAPAKRQPPRAPQAPAPAQEPAARDAKHVADMRLVLENLCEDDEAGHKAILEKEPAGLARIPDARVAAWVQWMRGRAGKAKAS